MTTRAESDAEKTAYEATETILINGWPGYQTGHRVPADVVKNNPAETDGKVKKV
jgi:hypothetical protein